MNYLCKNVKDLKIWIYLKFLVDFKFYSLYDLKIILKGKYVYNFIYILCVNYVIKLNIIKKVLLNYILIKFKGIDVKSIFFFIGKRLKKSFKYFLYVFLVFVLI